jgi:ribose 5-phosphate isomerase
MLEKTINNRPGVVENGLFIGIAGEVVIGTQASGVQIRLRS